MRMGEDVDTPAQPWAVDPHEYTAIDDGDDDDDDDERGVVAITHVVCDFPAVIDTTRKGCVVGRATGLFGDMMMVSDDNGEHWLHLFRPKQ